MPLQSPAALSTCFVGHCCYDWTRLLAPLTSDGCRGSTMQHQGSSLLQIARCSAMQSDTLHCNSTAALGVRLKNPVHCDAAIPRP